MSKEIKLLSCEIKIGRKKFKLVENDGGCKGCFFDYGAIGKNDHCPRGEYQGPICTVFNATSVWKEVKE